MKLRRMVIAGIVALGVGVGSWLALRPGNKEQAAVKATQEELRRQGFKVSLEEFDFSASPEMSARGGALMQAWPIGQGFSGSHVNLELMSKVSSNSALVVWKQKELTPAYSTQNIWPALRAELDANRGQLDASMQSVLSGPFHFNLNANAGSSMLLPHLAIVKYLEQQLGERAVLDLHDGYREAAWANLMAATRMVTAWDAEPVEVSQLVHCACATIAFDATWQVLQAGDWPDERLAALQHDWDGVDFFARLPETAAFNRASVVAMCEQDRLQGPGLGMVLREAVHAPRAAWDNFAAYRRQLDYLRHGIFEDEKGLLLFHRDRELEIRRAVQSSNWMEMRQLPGVTNQVFYRSKYPVASRLQAMMNSRVLMSGLQGRGVGLLGRAAEAEARRRLIITAIALERYRGQHGSYPATLVELTPEFLKGAPIDFMDRQQLRYRRTAEGRFVLYSVGLDCVDDGGQLIPSVTRGLALLRQQSGAPAYRSISTAAGLGILSGTDLVWPREASEADVKAQKEEEQRELEQEAAAEEERRAASEKEAEALRRETVEKLLAEGAARIGASASPDGSSPVLDFKGKPLVELLRNEKTAGTNKLSLVELLTIKQVFVGGEPDTVTFEVPVSYDAATNIGRMHLVVDGHLDAASADEEGERQTCTRATNGDCLLGWVTVYDAAGKHAIQAEFIGTKDEAREEDETTLKFSGPAVSYLSTNICQFNSACSPFDETGATLYAKLAESNGIYTIEVSSPTGEHVRTFKGSTTNGIIRVCWDLTDEQGRRYTNDSFNSTYDITLPDSGRSQKMR